MEIFQYAGIIRPPVPCDRFGTSLFQKDGSKDYYLQVEQKGTISEFKTIDVSEVVSPEKTDVTVKRGDAFIYSFITNQGALYFGDRKSIASSLLPLLESKSLNVHSKLLIASFLKLYGKTISLVEASNDDLQEKGVVPKLSAETAFTNAISDQQPREDILNSIYDRYIKYKGLNDSIQPDDILFINGNRAYFNNQSFNMNTIYNQRSLGMGKISDLISEIFTICNRKDRVNIPDLVLSNNEAYDFMLRSPKVIFDQPQIEGFLSKGRQKKDTDTYKSVIDIGINFDQKIYEEKVSPGNPPKSTTANEQDLEHSIRSIVGMKL